MKKLLFIVFIYYIAVACNKAPSVSNVLVTTDDELETSIKNAKPGDHIIMANGVWKDIQIKFRGKGTKDNPIFLKAETPGKVSIEGQSYLKFGGEYLTVEGLHFKNGYSPSNAVINFKIKYKDTLDEIANNCKVINCVIEDFNKPKRDDDDLWVLFWGRHNELSNCYIAGKTNRGPTVRVSIAGVESINNYHKIINNHFGPRPVKEAQVEKPFSLEIVILQCHLVILW